MTKQGTQKQMKITHLIAALAEYKREYAHKKSQLTYTGMFQNWFSYEAYGPIYVMESSIARYSENVETLLTVEEQCELLNDLVRYSGFTGTYRNITERCIAPNTFLLQGLFDAYYQSQTLFMQNIPAYSRAGLLTNEYVSQLIEIFTNRRERYTSIKEAFNLIKLPNFTIEYFNLVVRATNPLSTAKVYAALDSKNLLASNMPIFSIEEPKLSNIANMFAVLNRENVELLTQPNIDSVCRLAEQFTVNVTNLLMLRRFTFSQQTALDALFKLLESEQHKDKVQAIHKLVSKREANKIVAINKEQSTHEASVEASVKESALKLKARYRGRNINIPATINEVSEWLNQQAAPGPITHLQDQLGFLNLRRNFYSDWRQTK